MECPPAAIFYRKIAISGLFAQISVQVGVLVIPNFSPILELWYSATMIDWFSGYVGYSGSQLNLGRFVEISPNGDVIRDRDRWETARGSFEEGVQITRGMPTDDMLKHSTEHGFLCDQQTILRISGNPAKFLQGHNAAGPSVEFLGPVLQGMVRAFGEGFRPADADSEILPAVQRSRVDVTTAVDLGSHQAVHDWLIMAEQTTRSRHGRALGARGTVYWGKNSTRWSLKAYCKHCELKAHPPRHPELIPDLLEWTRPHLRIELTLRRPELRHRGTLSESVIWEYMRRIEMPNIKSQPNIAADSLTNSQKQILQLWLLGSDVATMYPKTTFYRLRRAILNSVGVDISLTATDQVKEDPKALIGVEELQRLEVLNIPNRIQRSLFGAG